LEGNLKEEQEEAGKTPEQTRDDPVCLRVFPARTFFEKYMK